MKPVVYRMIAHADATAFADEVTSYLVEGWELYGNPYSTTKDLGLGAGIKTVHYQAIVQYGVINDKD